MGLLDRVAEFFGYTRKAETIRADWLRLAAEAEQFSMPDSQLPKGQLELYQRLSWVQSAVATVARTAATTPFGVFKLTGEDKTAEENHEFELLLRRPNPLQSRFELLESTISYHALTGNAYWWLNRKSESAPPDEVWVVPSYRIKPVPDGKLYLKGYLYETDNGDELPLEIHEIVHFKRFHPLNSFVGLSPLEALSVITTGDLAMQRWNTNYFDKDNAKSPGALAFADPIDDSAWAKLKADVNAKHGGTKRQLMMLRNVGKGGVQWLNMAISQRDMEFLAGRTFNKEEIYSIYAPGLASILAVNATEANSKAGKATFLEMAVWPALVSVAEKITNNVLPVYGNDLIGEFDDIRINDRGMELAEQNTAATVQTIDELRQRFYNLSPLADGRGARLISESAEGQNGSFAIHDYHIRGGIITKDEARAYYGLQPLSAESPTELEAKFKAVQAGVAVGIPPERLFGLVGLDPSLLPSVTTTVTVAQPRQLTTTVTPVIQQQKEQPQDEAEQPRDEALDEDEAHQAEIKTYRKWLKKEANRQPEGFKATYLTDEEKAGIYAEVRQGVAPVDSFFREWESYP